MNNRYRYSEKTQPTIVFLSIALVFLLIFIGFFAWHTSRMRKYELHYDRTEGIVVDVKTYSTTNSSTHHGGTYRSLVISYKYDGKSYKFTDKIGYRYDLPANIGHPVKIYVNPKNPAQAERIDSAGSSSTISVCFFAFFCAAYSVGMNLLLSIKGTSFKKRFIFVWGMEILLGLATLLLFWLGLPFNGFDAVFTRISGAIGVTVIVGVILLIALLDGIITRKLHSKLLVKFDIEDTN